jgi:hypothetical protein
MRHLARGLAVLGLMGLAGGIGMAQATKTAAPAPKAAVKGKSEAKAEVPAGYRTLTGTIAEINAGDQKLKVELPEAGAKGARAAQGWMLGLGKQTLLLRAGKNGQFSMINFDELAKGQTIQAAVDLEGDADKSHRAWWMITYPAGTTPPGR